MATRILVAIVRGGELEGSFASVTDVDLAGDVEAFVARIKGWSISLADIESRHMTVFGPWASASAVPVDMGDATSGRGLDPADIIEPLVVGMARAYFLVRITTPPVAAGESGVELARHAWSVPTILVVREIRHSLCLSCIPRTRDSLFTIALARAFRILLPLSCFAGVGGAGSDMVAQAGGAGGAGIGKW
jgi:hypothetical protein